MPWERHSQSEEDTGRIAAAVAAVLRPGDILALDGPMGAGKTTFVRLLADALGVPLGMAASPTFVLAHVYPTARGWPLVHIDAYRLRSAEDLEAAGWDRLSDPRGVVVVEWAERVADALPADRVSWVRIGMSAAMGERVFTVEGELGARLADSAR